MWRRPVRARRPPDTPPLPAGAQDGVSGPVRPLARDVARLPSDPPSTAGLGTGWGEQLARRVLDEAGFVDVSVHDVPDDPFDLVYVARTPH